MCLFSLSPGIFSPNFYKPHRSAGLLVNTQHSGKTKTMCQRFDVSFETGLSMANCGWEHPYNWNIYPYYRIMNLKCVTVFLHKLKRILLKVPPAPLVTNKALLLEEIPVFWCILWLNVVVLFWSIGKKKYTSSTCFEVFACLPHGWEPKRKKKSEPLLAPRWPTKWQNLCTEGGSSPYFAYK